MICKIQLYFGKYSTSYATTTDRTGRLAAEGVRLQGTNAKEGKELIDRSGLKVHSAIQLQDAAELVNTVLG